MKIILSIVLLLFSVLTAKANTLTIITPAIDDAPFTNARIFSKYLLKQLPEYTSVEFKHVPGAAGVVAANYMFNMAPRDGNTIGITYKHIPFLGTLKDSNINYDSSKMTWLGSTQDGRKDVVLLLSHKELQPGLIVGTTPIPVANPITFINNITSLNLKKITGYKSSNEVRLAFERKEIDAFFNNYTGIQISRPLWFSDPNIKIIMQFGNGSVRNSRFPELITLSDISPKNYETIKAFEEQYILLRPFYAPPDIPNKIRLSKAFFEAANDPLYIRELAAQNIEVSPINYIDTERYIQNMIKLNANVLKLLK
jgi:hypothetical protein